MVTVEFKWYGDNVSKEIEATLWEKLQRAVVFLHTELLAVLNISNPRPYKTPSKPGEPPRKRTGVGQRNVVYDLDRKNLSGRFGVLPEGKHLAFLEKGTRRVLARPWLMATFERLKPQLEAMME